MIETGVVVSSGLKVTCSRDELVEQLAVVVRAVSARSAVQVLAGVQVSAADGRLELAATDMELSLRTGLSAEVDDAGTAVVPGRLLAEVARLLPEQEVVVEQRAEESTVHVTSGSATYSLNTYSAEDFPRLPEFDDAETSELEASAFLRTLNRVSRAASRDESRPVLTGILVRFEEGKLVMAATDSYRLAVKETAIDASMPPIDAIVPARALAEVARMAQGADAIELAPHENHVLFRAGETRLTTRRIDGQFPNYQQLLPESFEHELTLPRAEFLDVVRRVAVLAQRNSPLRLRFEDGELTISAQTQDVGEARESLPVPFGGEPLEIGFNADFLRDGIESLDEDELRLKLISPLRPGLIESEARDFRYLIMPIRLAG